MNDQGSDALNGLERWYMEQCDGDWEHSYGVKIDTLDNPGWKVEIELHETEWADLVVDRVIVSRSELDWFQYEVGNGKFLGMSGLGKLEHLVAMFLAVIGRPVIASSDDLS